MSPIDPRASHREPTSGPHTSSERRDIERPGQSYGPGYYEGIQGQQQRFEEQYGREFHSPQGAYRYEERPHDEYNQPGGPAHPRHHADYGRQQHLQHSKNFAGVGPKGYSPSDETIKEEVCHKLWEHDAIDASDLEVDVKDGKVIVTGSVPTPEMRELIEDVCDDFVPRERIELRLSLRRERTRR